MLLNIGRGSMAHFDLARSREMLRQDDQLLVRCGSLGPGQGTFLSSLYAAGSAKYLRRHSSLQNRRFSSRGTNHFWADDTLTDAPYPAHPGAAPCGTHCLCRRYRLGDSPMGCARFQILRVAGILLAHRLVAQNQRPNQRRFAGRRPLCALARPRHWVESGALAGTQWGLG